MEFMEFMDDNNNKNINNLIFLFPGFNSAYNNLDCRGDSDLEKLQKDGTKIYYVTQPYQCDIENFSGSEEALLKLENSKKIPIQILDQEPEQNQESVNSFYPPLKTGLFDKDKMIKKVQDAKREGHEDDFFNTKFLALDEKGFIKELKNQQNELQKAMSDTINKNIKQGFKGIITYIGYSQGGLAALTLLSLCKKYPQCTFFAALIAPFWKEELNKQGENLFAQLDIQPNMLEKCIVFANQNDEVIHEKDQMLNNSYIKKYIGKECGKDYDDHFFGEYIPLARIFDGFRRASTSDFDLKVPFSQGTRDRSYVEKDNYLQICYEKLYKKNKLVKKNKEEKKHCNRYELARMEKKRSELNNLGNCYNIKNTKDLDEKIKDFQNYCRIKENLQILKNPLSSQIAIKKGKKFSDSALKIVEGRIGDNAGNQIKYAHLKKFFSEKKKEQIKTQLKKH